MATRTILIIACVLVITLVLLTIASFIVREKNTIEQPVATPTSDQVAGVDVYTLAKNLESVNSNLTLEERADIVKTLKAASYDETLPASDRVVAGQSVVSTFFQYGTNLSTGFSDSEFSEREVYEYAKYINTLGDSDRNPLLVAYIGLRFYTHEINAPFVIDLINTSLRHINEHGTDNICGYNNKVASILYLSQKAGFTEVIEQFGDYYTKFAYAYATCNENRKTTVAFMWLAALSDIGTSETEQTKAQELVTLIIKDTAFDSRLVQYLKNSYFSNVPEPDTYSIVERLIVQYPEFKEYMEKVRTL